MLIDVAAYAVFHGLVNLFSPAPAVPTITPPAIIVPAPPMGQEMEAIARQIHGEEELFIKFGP